ncbi:dienelactone hydrolase family protein [Flavobacterium amniphilum]|uniref:dienelactone hydrolase family protein n=1 Tax=Flavobacterium amniphilum TaxID=1834035 RepID=UPI00202A2560|nr:dienelactone hydrolase family protein [Flavobacterium amniphilum]MCL9804254.1 dienelactone hydrolase family protein [Flavobacterium amniphilum]
MKKLITAIMLLVSKNYAISQKTPEDFGYKQLSYKYQNDKVDLIIITKPEDQKKAKPLFLFCQGSLPRPIVIYDEKGLYGTLPFNEVHLLEKYHIVIIGKPGIPIIANTSSLGKNFMYLRDKQKEIPLKDYTDKNHLDYYVSRNNFIVKQLFKERWVSKSELVVAGHSEGSTVAAKMASLNPKISRLIYSGGNPFGRIATILNESANKKEVLDYWETIVENSNVINYDGGDTYKATYSFSLPQKDNLLKLKIPILITYGSEDAAAIYNDLFQVEVIREQKKNIEFIAYPGLEHNFFPLNEKSEPIYEIEKWDNIANDWLIWLNKNSN